MSEFSTRLPSLARPTRRSYTPSAAARLPTTLNAGHLVVLTSLAAMLLIRFFTEEIHVVPRAANFIDIPLLLVVACFAAGSHSLARPAQRSTFFLVAVPFLALATASALINLHRVDVFPALTFVYGFLSPIAFYLAVYHLWEPGRARAVSKLLVAIASVQFLSIVFYDIPQFLRTKNPDFVSGTFGTNAYQLVFFLVWFVALMTGIVTYQPNSQVRFLALPFIAAAYLAIFLAQYRSILVTCSLATIFIGALVVRRKRGFFIAAAAISGLIASLLFMVIYVPTNKFDEAFGALRNNPSYFIGSRLDDADDVYRLYGDNWHYPIIGTGPGTYSSRAWDTFSGFDSLSDSNVAGSYVSKLMNGQPYQTDVSNKYVVPRLNGPAKYGTKQFTAPYSSYLALLAEVGLLAAIIFIIAYFIAFIRITRVALYFSKYAVPGDPLPALAVATATAFFVLLQLAIFGNWFETARVTIPTWMLLAIVMRELHARKEFEELRH